MKISLVTTKASKISLTEVEEEIENDVTLSYAQGRTEESDRHFSIKFDVNACSKEGMRISMEYYALFETDEDITDEYLSSHFATVNAPAIAYPYLRSFVSTLTLNAGYEPIMLPTINFVALARQETDKTEGSETD